MYKSFAYVTLNKLSRLHQHWCNDVQLYV